MKITRYLPMVFVSAFAFTASVYAAPIELEGIGLTRDIPCNGNNVNISGNGNNIVLTGKCATISVAGSEHNITFDTATSLIVTGAEIAATGQSTGDLTVAAYKNTIRTNIFSEDKPAKVNVTGTEHHLDLDFKGPAVVSFNGISNRLSWGGTEPKLSSSGANNVIKQKP
ncbi:MULTISPECIES: DUF3060 domain-containing protein [Pectobacterium]|uniref:DUF3060 domain-containing protein n=1 Tax=Pectobacterium TaxID=122277 RepID=UPI000C1C6428|nr:DUF3060 domain-containing protein [Pectobacterium brasiliense]ATV45359.1 hypothetical protein CTV95_18830 [Pectobacterium brasiliense]MBN3227406.1 DUF3060 domain-containing protein [Pectobacterium brasiliense]MBN3343102.1 DUF3060 domain-containing protein [Pectobacterium brasiliense]MBN7765528.1 DUF3060 domain-containing protein [Pectobacterium brasiliense]MCA6983069.1 DUF3060 domain-containing protein [Pectobacterium brasiliense]